MDKKKVILDVDTGSDDAVAIMTAPDTITPTDTSASAAMCR